MTKTLRSLVAIALLLIAVAPSAAFAQELPPQEPTPPPAQEEPRFPPVPEGSGEGRRVVYSNGQQRVWLVEEDGAVTASHLVSGRRNFPHAGNYQVFSRSPSSRAGSLTLKYMVRFARTRRLSVGFHAIPVRRNGRPIQSESELGQYRSHGCVRQRESDAEIMWNWAQLGTRVVVVR